MEAEHRNCCCPETYVDTNPGGCDSNPLSMVLFFIFNFSGTRALRPRKAVAAPIPYKTSSDIACAALPPSKPSLSPSRECYD